MAKYAAQFDLSSSILFNDASTMLDFVQPDAVAIFSNTFEHLEFVLLTASKLSVNRWVLSLITIFCDLLLLLQLLATLSPFVDIFLHLYLSS